MRAERQSKAGPSEQAKRRGEWSAEKEEERGENEEGTGLRCESECRRE